jgi:hypothetical protein
VELIFTDMHSYAMEDPDVASGDRPLDQTDFRSCSRAKRWRCSTAGRAYAGGKPPETVSFGEASIPTSGAMSRR